MKHISPVAAVSDTTSTPDEAEVVRLPVRHIPSAGAIGDVPNPSLCADTAALARTDFGVAERVLAHYAGRIAYRPAVGLHMVYDGKVWTPDEDNSITSGLIRRVIRSISVHEANYAAELDPDIAHLRSKMQQAKGLDLPDSTIADLERQIRSLVNDARADLEKYGHGCENGQRTVQAVLSILATSTASEEEEWDSHPFLVNTPNGTVNLKHRDGNGWPILREHDPADRITMMTAVDYVPGAESPDLAKVKAHLEQTGEGTYEGVTRYLGYALTGAMDAKRYLNFFGAPDAAKSTLTGAGALALGGAAPTSYVGTLSPGDLGIDPTSGKAPAPGLDACRGKRWIVISEAEHLFMSGDLVKRWTGGDLVRTRTLNAKGGAWQPAGKFVVVGNGASRFSAHDTGMVNRAIFVEVQRITGDVDEGIKYRMERTQEGQVAVLAMLIKAAADWYVDYKVNGLTAAEALRIPEHCSAAKTDALEDINPLTEWIEARCRRVDEGDDSTTYVGAAPSGVLHEMYQADARGLGLPPMRPREFAKNLAALPYVGDRHTEFSVGAVTYKGRIKTGLRYVSEPVWRSFMGGETF